MPSPPAKARRSTVDADAGLDLNYGAGQRCPAHRDLAVSFSHAPAKAGGAAPAMSNSPSNTASSHDERAGFSAAIFPRVILPTASHSRRREDPRPAAAVAREGLCRRHQPVRRRRLRRSIRAPGNRDFWQAGIAADSRPQQDSCRSARRSRARAPDAVGGTAQTRAGVGTIVKLSDHYALLFSGGPTWADHRRAIISTRALGLNF